MQCVPIDDVTGAAGASGCLAHSSTALLLHLSTRSLELDVVEMDGATLFAGGIALTALVASRTGLRRVRGGALDANNPEPSVVPRERKRRPSSALEDAWHSFDQDDMQCQSSDMSGLSFVRMTSRPHILSLVSIQTPCSTRNERTSLSNAMSEHPLEVAGWLGIDDAIRFVQQGVTKKTWMIYAPHPSTYRSRSFFEAMSNLDSVVSASGTRTVVFVWHHTETTGRIADTIAVYERKWNSRTSQPVVAMYVVQPDSTKSRNSLSRTSRLGITRWRGALSKLIGWTQVLAPTWKP